MTISMSRAERADLGQRGAQPGAARRRTHADVSIFAAGSYTADVQLFKDFVKHTRQEDMFR